MIDQADLIKLAEKIGELRCQITPTDTDDLRDAVRNLGNAGESLMVAAALLRIDARKRRK